MKRRGSNTGFDNGQKIYFELRPLSATASPLTTARPQAEELLACDVKTAVIACKTRSFRFAIQGLAAICASHEHRRTPLDHIRNFSIV
ncbi:MAG: hypothetical protein ACK4UZ_09855, partial [Rhizobium rhizophilum]